MWWVREWRHTQFKHLYLKISYRFQRKVSATVTRIWTGAAGVCTIRWEQTYNISNICILKTFPLWVISSRMPDMWRMCGSDGDGTCEFWVKRHVGGRSLSLGRGPRSCDKKKRNEKTVQLLRSRLPWPNLPLNSSVGRRREVTTHRRVSVSRWTVSLRPRGRSVPPPAAGAHYLTSCTREGAPRW